jgi:hypothetical protein
MLLLAAPLSIPVAVRARSEALGQCYTPHGDYVHDQHPCDDHSQVSSCCPTGWTCFSNNLCIVTSPSVDSAAIGTTSRGTCTNPSWDEEACGNFCLGKSPTTNCQHLANGAQTMIFRATEVQ